MSYKVKSLVYFVCFLTATFAYHITGNDNQFDNETSKEIAELKMEDVKFDKALKLK
ncbi:hypothetical protein [Maribacter sp. HTCC2170]|uniref:hypothetical protein n=1 Tax=Maribacter sp. (strain HTCC2170 / KCCM 42371) TaxID=313603 RepID=UPI00006AE5D2|nr:hypothetical protein [Maribacter sp. HTCC2170]EAR00612.1 hypothetical protein FB2170_08904 [Maribacter sp. HTCC2170]